MQRDARAPCFQAGESCVPFVAPLTGMNTVATRPVPGYISVDYACKFLCIVTVRRYLVMLSCYVTILVFFLIFFKRFVLNVLILYSVRPPPFVPKHRASIVSMNTLSGKYWMLARVKMHRNFHVISLCGVNIYTQDTRFI